MNTNLMSKLFSSIALIGFLVVLLASWIFNYKNYMIFATLGFVIALISLFLIPKEVKK